MRAIGVILAGGNNESMKPLTNLRADSAMPIGSCYRGLDFPLSCMSNSGIGKVAILTQYNSRSLHDHLSSAKWWDLGRKQGGLFVFSPFLSSDNTQWFRGTADALYQNMSYLKRSIEPYVVISSGNTVYKTDFNAIIRRHMETGADVTVAYKELTDDSVCKYGVISLDEHERITEFEEKPLEAFSNLVSTGIYVIQRVLLIKLLETVVQEGRCDLVKDVLIRYRKRLKIVGYRFEGYWRAINGIREYFEINMDFLKKDVRDLFTRDFPHIETKPKDEPPAKYNAGATVQNTLVGSGSIINGNVRDSVIFRRVFAGEETRVHNAIVMEGSFIGNHCVVEHAILDKEVVLSDGRQIIGTPEAPALVAKGAVI